MIVATLDAGALIAIERRKPRGIMLIKAAREFRARLFVPTPVMAEWWRGRTDVREHIRAALVVVPFPTAAAEAAGEVLGRIRVESERARLAVDVMVMAFAATQGGALVYTSDVHDLEAIGRHFPGVRVLGV